MIQYSLFRDVITTKRFGSKMASSNVTTLHNRIQFSVDQAVRPTVNLFSDNPVNKHQVELQGVHYNMKSMTNDSSVSDGGTANNMSTKAAVLTSASSDLTAKEEYGHIKLDISNSVLPREKLASSPSSNDGLAEDTELQIRSLGCELIQLAGKLLKLPQVIHRAAIEKRTPHGGLPALVLFFTFTNCIIF